MPNAARIEVLDELTRLHAAREREIQELVSEADVYIAASRLSEAEEALRKALASSRRSAAAWTGLARVHQLQGLLESSLQEILEAIRLEPGVLSRHHAFGFLHRRCGSPGAVSAQHQAILDSENRVWVEVCLLVARDALEDAVASLMRALADDPENSTLHRGLSFLLKTLSKPAEAEKHLALALIGEGRHAEAVLVLERLAPSGLSGADVAVELGRCQFRLWRGPDSRKTLAAAARTATDPRASLYFVQALQHSGRTEAAIAAAREGLTRFPDSLTLRFWELLMLPVLYESDDELEAYRQRFEQGLDILSREVRLETRDETERAFEALTCNVGFHLAYQMKNDAPLQRKWGTLVHRIMAARYPRWAAPRPIPPLRGGKLRVGYVSPHFFHHSVANTTIGWIRHRDAQRFEVFTYHLGSITDHVTGELRAHSDQFRHLRGAFSAMAERILEDELHVLVFADVGLSSRMTRLAGLRLAPVQCTTWGHPVTTGLPTIDSFLSGASMEPAQADEHYTETLVRLPNIGVAYEDPGTPTVRPERAEFGLPEDAVVYLSFQSLSKYVPAQDAVLAAIAGRVPRAVLLFSAAADVDAITLFRERLARAFRRAGVEMERRCLFLPRLSWLRYLSMMRVCDVFLDTLGWSGCNTTLEALAWGLPIVTCPGDTMRSRHSSGILEMLGETGTIARDIPAYVEIAVRLGLDSEERHAVRERLRAKRGRAYEDVRCVSALEEFYVRSVEIAR